MRACESAQIAVLALASVSGPAFGPFGPRRAPGQDGRTRSRGSGGRRSAFPVVPPQSQPSVTTVTRVGPTTAGPALTSARILVTLWASSPMRTTPRGGDAVDSGAGPAVVALEVRDARPRPSAPLDELVNPRSLRLLAFGAGLLDEVRQTSRTRRRST